MKNSETSSWFNWTPTRTISFEGTCTSRSRPYWIIKLKNTFISCYFLSFGRSCSFGQLELAFVVILENTRPKSSNFLNYSRINDHYVFSLIHTKYETPLFAKNPSIESGTNFFLVIQQSTKLILKMFFLKFSNLNLKSFVSEIQPDVSQHFNVLKLAVTWI